MQAPLADLAMRFRFNENLLGMVSKDFTPAEWDTPPGAKGGNTAHWILGHVAASRRYLERKLGEGITEEPWEAAFGTKTPPGDPAGYPGAEVLAEHFKDSGKRLGARLGAMDEAALAVDWGSSFPDGGKSLADGARFMYFHECYHLGQIGILRRVHGLPGFV